MPVSAKRRNIWEEKDIISDILGFHDLGQSNKMGVMLNTLRTERKALEAHLCLGIWEEMAM